MTNSGDEHEPSMPSGDVQSFIAYLQSHPEAKKKLEAELLEGIRSPGIVGDASFWAERRRKIRDKHPELKTDH